MPVSFPKGNSLACTSWAFCLCICAHTCARGSTCTHADSREMKLLVPWYSPRLGAEPPGDLPQQLRAGAMWHQRARISSQAGPSTGQAELFTGSFPNWQEMEGFVFLLVFSAMTCCGASWFDQAPRRTCAVRVASPALFFASIRETSPWTIPSSPGTQVSEQVEGIC